MADLILNLATASSLLATLVAGALLAFSDFLMRGFRLAGPVSGMQAMQGLNRTVLKSVTLTVFLLLVPGLLALAGLAQVFLEGAPRHFIQLAAGVYTVGAFLVTGLGNVPMNKRLERLSAPSDYWTAYLTGWTFWNHVRTAACALTALFLTLAVRLAA
ncbi:DUF1772 domain-containing protein [Maricaulis parjimensis]|uniref:anthrone oxygenase family protein n=1 Tax=Maricaulis parjimensis TaxID=144023 RepID=UPI00193A55EE|nr:anthrone oxygenase family protein [Maricaulis parjimensis]